MTQYNQPKKSRARTLALTHAVEILTTRRSHAAAVPQGYVASVKETLSKRTESSDVSAAAECDENVIQAWEAFWYSKTGNKLPAELTVGYLAGPEPLNDFRTLVELGVDPHNIVGFESDSSVFNDALAAAKASEFPMLKIMRVPLDRYLAAVPTTFDILYFDACGPLPSKSQRTLRTIASIFRYQRLNPLSVLITNFSAPDLTNETLVHAYAELVSGYLYPRAFQETENSNWNLEEGPAANDFVAKNVGKDDSFFDVVLKDLHRYYGNYITRQLFDLGSLIVPLARLASSGGGNVWSMFFAKSADELAKLAIGRKAFDSDGNGGDYVSDPDMNALGWTFSALLDSNNSTDYPVVDPQSRDLLDVWIRELGGDPEMKVRGPIDAYYLLRDSTDEGLLKPSMEQLLVGYRYFQKMHLFCDVPSRELALYPVLSQFAYPYHYNVQETRRYRYTAEGKSTEMFLDVIPFDTCRYIYDWLPSTELVPHSFEDSGHQLVYRFALDGLVRHTIRYNNEYIYGGSVVGVDVAGHSEHVLAPRKVIKLRRPSSRKRLLG